MASFEKIKKCIKQTNSSVLVFGCVGIFFIFIGGFILGANPPNLQVGYPTTSIGLACFIFAISIDNAIKSAKKTDQILVKLDEIHKELIKKNEP
jgi:hypothetical protein